MVQNGPLLVRARDAGFSRPLRATSMQFKFWVIDLVEMHAAGMLFGRY